MVLTIKKIPLRVFQFFWIRHNEILLMDINLIERYIFIIKCEPPGLHNKSHFKRLTGELPIKLYRFYGKYFQQKIMLLLD